MPTPRVRVFLPLAVLLAGRAAAAPGDAPAELLGRVRSAYSKSASVTATFTQSYAPAGFPDQAPETGTLVLAAPDRLRFAYDGPEGKLFAFDGKTARQYVAADKQMVEKPLLPEERARLPLVFFETPEAILGRFDARTNPLPSDLVDLTLASRDGGDPRSLTLTVAPSGEVKRLVVLDSAGNRTTFTFTKLTAGKARPASDFAPVPPPGTRVLTP